MAVRFPGFQTHHFRISYWVFALLVGCFGFSAGSAEAAQIEVEELSDIDFGDVPPSVGELTAENTFCVALVDRGNYQIRAFGNAPNGAFVLLGADGLVSRGIAYRVFVNERGGGRGAELAPGVPLGGLRSRARLPNGRCSQPQPRITVSIPAGEIGAASSGSYRGSLALTVAPE